MIQTEFHADRRGERKATRLPLQLLFLILFTGLMSGACSAAALPGVVTVSTPSPTLAATSTPLQPVSPSATNSPIPSATPAPPALPRYVIDALMDYDAKTLEIQQEIDYPNNSGSALNDLLLAVEPNRIPGVFTLKQLSVDDAPLTDYNLTGQKLSFKLATPLENGQTVKLTLSYTLTLPPVEQGDPNLIRPQIFGVTTRQVNLTDWYPFVVPFQAGGWVLHDPWFYGEHLVYPLADFDVSLRFTDAANAPLVAASTAAEPIDGGARYRLAGGRDFAFAMGRQMKSVSAQVQGVTVTSYYYPGAETGAQAVLEATTQAVQTYSGLFGAYPHQTLAAVQGDFNDGMEFDGLYYLSNAFYNLYDNTEKNYLVMVAVHETSHQWWFGLVANDQNDHPWLDEALATYCEKLFYEKNYPASVDWWWAYRIDFYQPEGKIDGAVPGYGGFTPYTNATYRRGAHFFDKLRQQMGDELFFAFLKNYAADMAGKIAAPEDFFRILRASNPPDLSALLSKYFDNPPQ